MTAWSPRQLRTFLDRIEPAIDHMTHFELLDVTPDIDSRGIRDAFRHIAAKIHPDLYRQHISAQDHERLTRLYGRIAEAYLVLRDATSRNDYIHTLQKTDTPPRTAPGPVVLDSTLPLKARRMYRRARASMRTGDYASAVLELRMAVASAPNSALLRQALSDALELAGSRE
ncbi:MAG: J domain-containing protein [Proteobacteria bacterium]|nr:J domain-containing protein [Pseudomonadota bacterium]